MNTTQLAADSAVSTQDALAPVALLLGGVPTLTLFVMSAVRYISNGSL